MAGIEAPPLSWPGDVREHVRKVSQSVRELLASGDSGPFLPLSGGTMTGTINSQDVTAKTDAAFDLGKAGLAFRTLYLNNNNARVIDMPDADTAGGITDYTMFVGGGDLLKSFSGFNYFRILFQDCNVTGSTSNVLEIDFGQFNVSQSSELDILAGDLAFVIASLPATFGFGMGFRHFYSNPFTASNVGFINDNSSIFFDPAQGKTGVGVVLGGGFSTSPGPNSSYVNVRSRTAAAVSGGINGDWGLFRVGGGAGMALFGNKTGGVVSQALFSVPTITPGAFSVTHAATVHIKNQPSVGTNKYALYVQDGLTQLSGNVTANGSATAHRYGASNSTIGFFGATPVARQTGYTTFTNLNTDRTCDADATSVAELADILGTLIVDLKTIGLIAA